MDPRPQTPQLMPDSMRVLRRRRLDEYRRTLSIWVRSKGPRPDEYGLVNWLFGDLANDLDSGLLTEEDLRELQQEMAPAFALTTMQGMAFHKPHGYPGDFEIIERIYDRYVTADPALRRWDEYWQANAAARAVRNRVDTFHDRVGESLEARRGKPLEVLNVASGPGCDVASILARTPEAQLHVVCVDADANALARARHHCDAVERVPPARTTFLHRNVFKLQQHDLAQRPDLVWCAGLFDYFDDDTFVKVLRKLAALAKPNAEIIVGNFATTNPSRGYMRLFDWNLFHRTSERLLSLAFDAVPEAEKAWVDREPEGVNLFLRLRLG